MRRVFGSAETVLSSDWIPEACEPGPANSEPGICTWENMRREPTWRITGFSFSVDLSIRTRSSGWIRRDSGTDIALDGRGAVAAWAQSTKGVVTARRMMTG